MQYYPEYLGRSSNVLFGYVAVTIAGVLSTRFLRFPFLLPQSVFLSAHSEPKHCRSRLAQIQLHTSKPNLGS